ncbi:MAG: HAMP domain-containing histidine kinase [Spirulinaceae cyanobacterium RM2_2_10]|nr:HAMP domain-containing histidine kinase [Spirulinaceae cyanobacterium SM2_1_0]NJO19360.1 HAMP domain-containing histidine kinase [Spirulinaceae cyanobacterium RM2_2_10]
MDIQAHQFIAFFEAEQAQQLCEIATLVEFSDRAIIFEEGEIPDFLYLVLNGQVLFRKRITDQHYQVVARAIPDDFFGEFGILDGQPRSAQALVCEGATLAKIPRRVLVEILNNTRSSAILKLFRYVIQRLRVTTEDYVRQIAHKDKMVLVGEMVNTIIHDLKSPLSGIQLASGMVKEMHIDEETVEWCDLIQIQAHRMTAMAEELLEFARGSAALEKRPIVLADLFRRFEKLNRIYLSQENIALKIDCPDDLVINADENKLMRVIQNLVVNAVEAFNSHEGRIEITALQQGDRVKIRLQDNGPGIPCEIRETFFESFVTHGKKSGTGLGTAIAKSVIDAHRGEIYFETADGVGTTFFISLPL